MTISATRSAACGMAQTAALTAGTDPVDFVRIYLSREHRDAQATVAAVAGGAAHAAKRVIGAVRGAGAAAAQWWARRQR